ncbi:hypothetical protein B484DRAFT_459893, partial [Ochromonadaceae sp. CCMP2298]
HYFDLSNSAAGPKELSLLAESIKYNFTTVDGVAPLITMELSGNQVCGVDFLMSGDYESAGLTELVNVIVHIGVKSRLRKITLSRNYIGLRGCTIISNLLTNGPTSLIELGLRDCGAHDDAITKLMDGLKGNKSLQLLDISHNCFGKEGCEAVGEMLTLNSKLRQLTMSECSIGPLGTAEIARGLSTNTGLEALLLGDNGIGDAGAEAIASCLKVNKSLKQLDIQENDIGLVGITAIAEALKGNRVLTFLGVQWNALTNQATIPLGEALKSNTILRGLHILGTDIDAEGIKHLVDTSLGKLDLDLSFAYVQ